MTEQTRKKIIYVAFVAALIWGIFNNPFQGKETSLPVTEPVAIDSVTTVLRTVQAVSLPIQIDEMAGKAWGQDPFRPIVKQTAIMAEKQQWKLSGIIYQGQEPIAIVNGQSVRIGDEIGEARIIDITKKTVTIDHNGSQKTLTVGKG